MTIKTTPKFPQICVVGDVVECGGEDAVAGGEAQHQGAGLPAARQVQGRIIILAIIIILIVTMAGSAAGGGGVQSPRPGG